MLNYEVWKEPGKCGRTYYVFEAGTDHKEAVKKTAQDRHLPTSRLEAYYGFIKGDKELTISDDPKYRVVTAKKAVVVTGKGAI